MTIDYKTKGTCSSRMRIEVEDGVVRDIQITGGCDGNLQGLSRLVTGMKVEALIHALRKECTMVVAVHSPQMAGRIAEESAMMEDGRVLEWGRTSDLFYHPKHLHTEQFVSSRFL